MIMENFRLNKQKFESSDSQVAGRQILKIGGLEPVEDFELLKKINEAGFEPIQLDEVVDLKEAGIEGFFAKPYKKLIINVGNQPIEVDECFMTPLEILVAAGIKPKDFFLKQLKGHVEICYKNDRNHKVALKNGAKFITCKLDKAKITIIVNGTPHEIEKGHILYAEVVTLAFPDFPQHPERTYSVTYEKGQGSKPAGILSPGGKVRPKDRMIFKVKHTGQS